MRPAVVFFLGAAIATCCGVWALAAERSAELEFNGWQPASPRAEIRPTFSVHQDGGPDGRGGLVIAQDRREELAT